MQPMGNRLPVGKGSRGGHWHDREWRRAYYRAWRAAHPEYREREILRRARQRARAKGDPADIAVPSSSRPLPAPAEFCACGCSCNEPVVIVCGFCRDGFHDESIPDECHHTGTLRGAR
jgi:hypothetical protein